MPDLTSTGFAGIHSAGHKSCRFVCGSQGESDKVSAERAAKCDKRARTCAADHQVAANVEGKTICVHQVRVGSKNVDESACCAVIAQHLARAKARYQQIGFGGAGGWKLSR